MRAVQNTGTALLLLLAASSPVAAQDYSASVGWYAGAIHASALNQGAGAVVTGGESRAPVAIQPDVGWMAGAFYEHWTGKGYLGYRLNGALSQSPVPWNGASRQVRAWLGDVDLVLRPLGASAARKVFPFLAVGAGGVVYDMGRGLPVSFESANAIYSGRQDPRFAAVASGGFDIITPWSRDYSPIIVRIQVGDHMMLRSPLKPLFGGGTFDPVHQLHAEIALHAGIGQLGDLTTRVH